MYTADPFDPPTTETEGNLQEVITKLPWIFSKELDGGKKLVRVHGKPLALPTPDPSNFVPFSDLTQEQVSNWIENSLTQEAKEFYESKADETYSYELKSAAKWEENKKTDPEKYPGEYQIGLVTDVWAEYQSVQQTPFSWA